jgi:hypothetical protein
MPRLLTRGRPVRAVLVLLALILGAGTAVTGAAPGPATAAGGGILVCLPVLDDNGNIVDEECHWLTLAVVDLCPPCPDWAITLDPLVNPADRWYVEDLGAGLALLDQAAGAGPREAAVLRAAAQDAFLAAAGRLGGTAVRPGVVGTVDWEHRVIEPDPEAWLVAAATDLAGGLNKLAEAVANPEPTPWLRAGMAQLQEAYQEIVQQQPIGT